MSACVRVFLKRFCATVTPSAQLLEQTARLQSLSDTLARLKVINHQRLLLTHLSHRCGKVML